MCSAQRESDQTTHLWSDDVRRVKDEQVDRVTETRLQWRHLTHTHTHGDITLANTHTHRHTHTHTHTHTPTHTQLTDCTAEHTHTNTRPTLVLIARTAEIYPGKQTNSQKALFMPAALHYYYYARLTASFPGQPG